MEEKIQGSVWLECVVGETGDVGDVEVTRSLDTEYGLDQAAIDAARQWKFKPGTKDGKPVAVRITIELTFTLRIGPWSKLRDGISAILGAGMGLRQQAPFPPR